VAALACLAVRIRPDDALSLVAWLVTW